MYQSKEDIKAHYFEVEGGAVNNEDDLGGKTGSGGITFSLLEKHKNLWASYNYEGGDNIPYDLTMQIFDLEFWNKCMLDDLLEVSPALAEAIYGWALNSGASRPIKVLQRHLNVMNNKGARYANIVADGYMGKNTLKTLKGYLTTCSERDPINKLVRSICYAQWTFYLDISEKRSNEANETFTDGWLNRIQEKIERIL